MRRIVLLLTATAMMAAIMAVSAGPASALVIFDRDNDHNDNDRNDHNRDAFFFGRNDGFEFSGPNFDDQELESGDIETETDISIEGNNNNQCVGALQFGQTGNFANQQGTGDFFGDDNDGFWDFNDGDNEFVGPEVTFAPENETACDQAVQQSSAASSWGW